MPKTLKAELSDMPADDGKNKAARWLGRRGGPGAGESSFECGNIRDALGSD